MRDKIDNIFNYLKEDLDTLVKIPSVNSEPVKDKPFGLQIHLALEKVLEIAQKLGFKTYIDPDGYYGYAEIGQGDLFGVLGHIDVVSAGDISEWKYPPFELTEDNNNFYGRGTTDDKGPILACMYALKILLDSGEKLNKRVRFIFGVDEESLWRDIKKYLEKEEHPTMGFAPDGAFPLTNVEKALLNYSIISNETTEIIFEGGDAINCVPSWAVTTYDKNIEDMLNKLNYEYIIEGDNIKVIGKSVHAKRCDEGINAITRLAEAMVKCGKKNSMLEFIVDKCLNPTGLDLFGDVSDNISGNLNFNLGLVNFNKDEQTLKIDMRLPISFDKEKAEEILIKEASKYNLKVEKFDDISKLYIPEDSELVLKLMDAYQKVTGDFESKPKSTGGATYARALNNMVSYGVGFKNTPETEHQANEYLPIENIKKAMEIYCYAFKLLVMED